MQKFDNETQAYFDSLPPLIQEQVMQSGFTPGSAQELQAFYQHILHSSSNTIKPENL